MRKVTVSLSRTDDGQPNFALEGNLSTLRYLRTMLAEADPSKFHPPTFNGILRDIDRTIQACEALDFNKPDR